MSRQTDNAAILNQLSRMGETYMDAMLGRMTQAVEKAESMKKVIAYEYRSNNSTQHTVAKLECGHERVFEYGYYPKTARCWDCPKEPCPDCQDSGVKVSTDTSWNFDGPYLVEREEKCPCRRKP